jgi:hypothetical protein
VMHPIPVENNDGGFVYRLQSATHIKTIVNVGTKM